MSSASMGNSLSSYFSNGNLYQQFCDQFKTYDPGNNGIPLESFMKMCQDASKSGNTQLAQIDYLLCSNPELFKQLSTVSTSEDAGDGKARVSLKDIQGILGQQTYQYPPSYPVNYQVPYYLPPQVSVYSPYAQPTQGYYPAAYSPVSYTPASYSPYNQPMQGYYPTSYPTAPYGTANNYYGPYTAGYGSQPIYPPYGEDITYDPSSETSFQDSLYNAYPDLQDLLDNID